MIKMQLFIGNFHRKKFHIDIEMFRLQTHITILEQQHNSQGYFSHEETPSIITEHVRR